jgi:hypothetical protein
MRNALSIYAGLMLGLAFLGLLLNTGLTVIVLLVVTTSVSVLPLLLAEGRRRDRHCRRRAM